MLVLKSRSLQFYHYMLSICLYSNESTAVSKSDIERKTENNLILYCLVFKHLFTSK